MEMIIIFSLVSISLVFGGVMIYKSLTGKKSCDCPMAKNCPGKCPSIKK
ncbi:MAG: hypothetical protein JEZ07_14940 [Phycisphaerae bacterium]|nr:hypothetical protein [Phycisphaerae bacterium]